MDNAETPNIPAEKRNPTSLSTEDKTSEALDVSSTLEL